MWEQQDVNEDQPQATTLGDMLTMIAAHDQVNIPSVCEREEQTRVTSPS